MIVVLVMTLVIGRRDRFRHLARPFRGAALLTMLGRRIPVIGVIAVAGVGVVPSMTSVVAMTHGAGGCSV